MGTVGPIIPGLPGIRATKTATPRRVFRQVELMGGLSQGRTIQGSQSRDPGNTGDIDRLRAGLLMGKITAATFGTVDLWAPSIIGVTTGAYTSGGTSLTVSAAQALEIERIVGGSGTAELVAIGPPTAAGTVAVTDVDHSAINTTTGVLTVTSLGVDKIAGTFIAVKDGRQIPRSFIPDGWPIPVTDSDGSTSLNVQYPDVPIAGVIDSSQIINWPSDTSLQTWIVDKLNTYGQYVFDHNF